MNDTTTQLSGRLRANEHNARLAPHAIANLFPAVEGPDLHSLAQDIRQHGLREPITLYDGKILDGYARYRACVQAHVEPHFRQYTGENPLEFAISANLQRRHLSQGQRAMIAAKIESFRHGGDRRSSARDANLQLDRDTAAKRLNVSTRSVANAAVVRDHGVSELQSAVLQGEVAVSAAATFAQQEPHEQRRWIEKSINVPCAVRAFQRDCALRGPYQDLLASIAMINKLMRHSVTNIVAEIPDEQCRSNAVVVERFKNFFTELETEMRKRTTEKDHIAAGDDRAQIHALFTKAKKTFGRTDQKRIIQAVIPALNAAQLRILRAGEFGIPAKLAAERASGYPQGLVQPKRAASPPTNGPTPSSD
jgi:hypothetical protein